jgi:hypothetical protein
MVEFTISRLGQSYSLARLMSSLLPVSGATALNAQRSGAFRLSIPPDASNTSRFETSAAAKRKIFGGPTMRPNGKTKLGFFPLAAPEAERLKNCPAFASEFSALDPPSRL